MDVLEDEVARSGRPGYGPRILVGGGLKTEHVPRLRAAGIDGFHVGTMVREAGWESPLDAGRVQQWRRLLDAAPLAA
jgi:copper homeostasis protein